MFSGGHPQTPVGWIVTLASPANPTAQISFFTEERTAPVVPGTRTARW